MKITPHFLLKGDYMFMKFTKILILLIVSIGGNLLSAEEKTLCVSNGNAAFYYNKAFKKIEGFPGKGDRTMTHNIIKNGWSGKNNHIKDYIKKDRGIIPIMRKAGHCYECAFIENIKFETEMPFLSKARDLSLFLMLKKRYFEFKGDCKKAVECFIMTKTLINHLSNLPPSVFSIFFSLRDMNNTDIDFIFDCPLELQKDILKKLLISDSKRTPICKGLMWDQEYKLMSKMLAGCIKKGQFQDIPLKTVIMDEKKEEILSNWKRILKKNLRKTWGTIKDSLCIQPYSEVKQVINEIDTSILNFKKLRNDLKREIRLLKENKSEKNNINNYIGDRIIRILIAMPWSSLKRHLSQNYLSIFRERAVILKIALKIYEKETGEYPENLSALIPKYIPFYPLDPYNGMPLKYKKDKDGCTFYSVGPDIKDSKGEQMYEPGQHKLEGDIVYELKIKKKIR